MSPQSQPAVSHSLSQLERCSPELLERIALLVTEERFLGPPSDLLALLTTSKTVNFALSPKNNNSLYAKVFALKFDIAAAKRRLTPRWLTSKCLATELRLRFAALRRIRGGIVDHTFRDLWTVFFILLEHDHKNALQLTEWAGAHTYANLVAERWLNGSYGPEFGEQAGGIVCTIIRELVREADLTESWRRNMQTLLYGHVLCGYRFSSFYASEEFFTVKEQPDELRKRVLGNPPVTLRTRYYGHNILIAAPPLASTCLSVFMIGMQPNSPRYTPGYMKEYIPGRTFSERMDNEWHRLVSCHSVPAPPSSLGGSRFTPSTLVGSWKGAVLVPNIVGFRDFLRTNPPPNPLTIPMTFFDGEMELREHHCLGDDAPLMPGEGSDGVCDDPLRAWIPQGTTFDERNDTLTLYDPIEDHRVVYQTYRVGAENPYASGFVQETRWVSGDAVDSDDLGDSDDEELEQPRAEIINNEPGIPDETQGLDNNPSYIDDDEVEDTVKHRDSGIRDIMITGMMKTGDHEHPLVGRIRAWDALIILHRLPSSPEDPPAVSWVFRGYVHGERHIVGRWKQTHTPVGQIGWEGGFVFRKDS